jgi:hypothetical protein
METESKQDEETKQEEDLSFELGDRIQIVGGKYDNLRGKIYYLDENILRVLPDGVSHHTEKIDIIDGEFDPALGIEVPYILQKRAKPSFVEQNDIHVGQLLETFTEAGEVGPVYKITAVNPEEDSVSVIDTTGAEDKIIFNYIGIPLDRPFVVVRNREAVSESTKDDKEELAAAKEEEEEFEVLDRFQIAPVFEVREVAGSERVYSDLEQRNSMLEDFFLKIPVSQQKSEKKRSEARKLVEMMMILRNDLIKYDRSGEPVGVNPMSYSSLAELVESTSVPLVRPVIDAKRVLYMDHSVVDEQNETTSTLEGIKIEYLADVVTQSVEYYERELGGVQADEYVPDRLPTWYLNWDVYASKFMSSWQASGNSPMRPFTEDSEFFRTPAPEWPERLVDGLPDLSTKDDDIAEGKAGLHVGMEDKIYMSLLRGLAGRSGRLNAKEESRVIETPERASVLNYILFPMAFDRELGAIRSSKLAYDIGRSKMEPMTMEAILFQKKGISDVPVSDGILSFSGSSLGNIQIEDWLKTQPLESKGLGDILPKLHSLGLTTRELSVNQMLVLIEKVKSYRALVRKFIAETNEKSLKKLENLKVYNNMFLSAERSAQILSMVSSEPILQETIVLFQARFPSYRENDLATFGYLLDKYSDYVYATLSSKPTGLVRERIRATRDSFLESVHESARVVKKKRAAGERPQPNPCPHVRSLSIIKKVKDKTSYFKLLAKFITQYGGERKDNWLHCISCSQTCLCYHEILLLQEYLRPREKEVIHKELLLTFSGGQFHGRYICKNDGQPISDVEYDTNLEYDDDGRPLMGRSVLADLDAEKEEELNILLGAPVEKVENFSFSTDVQNLIYKTLRQIADKIGISFVPDDTKKIVQRVDVEMMRQPTREEYGKMQKASKAKGGTIPDYDIFYHRILVSATSAQILLSIQTNIPGYVMRYKLPGCKAGFTGFPLGPEEDKTGVNYLSCAVASIMKNEPPWNLTGFQKGAQDKREALIAVYVSKLVGAAINDANVQQEIALKKEYLKETVGKDTGEEGLVEALPESFHVVREGEVIVPEAAGEQEKVRGWILQANEIAKASANAESVYTETTCCFTPLHAPQEFWLGQKDMVKLEMGRHPAGPRGSHLAVHFTSPHLSSAIAIASEEDYYRVFLEVCFDGPRKGLSHEPGYNHVCPHCGFAFPGAEYTLEEGKAALDKQEVEYGKDAFTDLLDTTHRRYAVGQTEKVDPLRGIQLLEKLATLDPPPFEGWAAGLAETMTALRAIPQDKLSDELEIATAYGSISNFGASQLQELTVRMGKENGELLGKLVSQSLLSCAESVRSYFLVPFQQFVSGFKTSKIRVQKSYDLGEGTVTDIDAFLATHLNYLKDMERYAQGNRTKAKMKYAVKQLSVLLPFFQTYVRAPLVPGGKIGLPYLVQSSLLGIFNAFIDPNHVPPKYKGKEEVSGERAPMQVLNKCLEFFRKEGLSLSLEEIRDRISRRNEAEKIVMIGRLDKMTPEARAVELLNKKLGLGAWAVGGSKVITQYNEDQYERERIQRFEMGLGPAVEQEAGAEGGYDVDQVAADDY